MGSGPLNSVVYEVCKQPAGPELQTANYDNSLTSPFELGVIYCSFIMEYVLNCGSLQLFVSLK
jgi:hypothetical protein